MRLTVHRSPDSPAELRGRLEEYTAVADSAFGRQTGREATLEHTVDNDVLVELTEGGAPVGFASKYALPVDGVDARTSYLHGVVVDRPRQQSGLGRTLVSRCLATGIDPDEPLVLCGTTQNPAVLSLMNGLYRTYPAPDADEPFPDEAAGTAEAIAAELTPGCEVDPPVIRERYGGLIYDEIPDHPFRAYTDSVLEYRRGDAILFVGRTTGRAARRAVTGLPRADPDPADR